MDFTEVVCALCGKEGYRMGMVRMTGTDGKPIGGGYRCPDGKCALPKSQPKPQFPFDDLSDQKSNKDGSYATSHLRVVRPSEGIKETDYKRPPPTAMPGEPERMYSSIQQEFGFKQPEDGSGQRYADRRAKTPWARHTFWWVLHNAVAHPLIAFVPVRVFFRFHDWTSRRMHGLK